MHFPDPRIWLPAAVAIAILAGREVTRPGPAVPVELGHAVVLPRPLSTAAPKHELDYELDTANSSIRFLVERDGESSYFSCPAAEGELHLSPDPDKSYIRLRFRLASLQPLPSAAAAAGGDTLWNPLGLERHIDLIYEAGLVSRSTTPIKCLTRQVWLGTLQFGSRSVRQPVDLWQTAYPGRPLRLQGHGTVAGDAYGLPRRGLFAFLHDKHAVTLGLDLAWKRARND